ncbi:hypothetical protein HanHA300_Chr12g0442741 [Helianthus annuus]|nr:hypothetical protein HanHA300_Chr12g0442741 [Helianthus annuus]KAJ0505205.1 hypothetical protein HanHA89_Chr12g0467861 [Helianthus annuus]KAJ0674888.1 hypothetical protein HanLR1_Chr12g0444971 [Helianthus annuus]
MTQEFSFIKSERTFFRVKLHVDFSKILEGFLDVIKHLVFRFAFDHQVIDIRFHVSSNLAFEGFIDESLVSGSRVLEVKRHLLVTENALVCVESRFFFILFFHEDLVIAFVCIKKAFERVSREGINLKVNFWKRVAIFRTSFVKILEIYTHSPRVVGFPDHDRISNP